MDKVQKPGNSEEVVSSSEGSVDFVRLRGVISQKIVLFTAIKFGTVSLSFGRRPSSTTES
jgi:hypothetical protein